MHLTLLSWAALIPLLSTSVVAIPAAEVWERCLAAHEGHERCHTPNRGVPRIVSQSFF